MLKALINLGLQGTGFVAGNYGLNAALGNQSNLVKGAVAAGASILLWNRTKGSARQLVMGVGTLGGVRLILEARDRFAPNFAQGAIRGGI